jgi:glycosyltransferase involved in cell wall biosynthesis
MYVSVIICTRNRPDLIGAAVRSVLANSYPSFDLLVVDQSTDDRTGAIVRGLMSSQRRLRYLHTATPGLSRAYNIGIRESAGQLLAFTDDDCIVPPDWISSIVREFKREPGADMLYGQVLRPAELDSCDDYVPTLAIHRRRRVGQQDGFMLYGMGANFAARRRLFERVGPFDEMLGGGGPLKSSQDFDLQFRAFRAGATVLLSPNVRVDHYGRRAHTQWPATLHAYGFGDGAFYFKHVRCGDWYALFLLVRRIGHLTASEVWHRLRRRPSATGYLLAYFDGIRASRRFAVDRRARLYCAA